MILFLLKTLSRLLDLFPRRFLGFAGDAAGFLWFHGIRFRRNVVLENLRLAFPDWSEAERRATAAANFRHYGRTVLEVMRSFGWNRERYAREPYVIHRIEIIQKLMAEGRGGILLTSHLGNWEMSVGTAGTQGLPFDAVVKRARSPQVDSALRWYREKTGCGMLVEEGTLREIFRSISRGRFVAFILDQFMGPPIGLPVTFFGHEAGTAVALALITERGVPVIPVYSFRDSDGVLHSVFEEPVDLSGLPEDRNDRLFEKTQRFNDVLERHVRRHPDQWLWLHRRWKPYRGTTRWTPVGRTALATTGLLLALLAGLTGCTAAGPAITGIEVPSDPNISVPEVKQVETTSSDSLGIYAVTPTPSPTPTPEPKRARKKKAEAPKPAPNASPTPLMSMIEVKNLDRIPFALGERLELDLSWTALSAGRAVLEVREGTPFNGRPTFLLWGNILSSKLVDAIYHIDNTIESYVDAMGLIPYKFLLHMFESKQKKETRVSFDHTKGKAFYWSKRISQQWGNEDKDRTDVIPPLTKDMFSAVYFARTLDYELGKKQSVQVYENGQNMTAELTPVANELVRTKAGIFQCWKVQLTIKLNNVLRPTGDIFMWLSDDSKRYVVKFDAKIKIGSLVGTLVNLRERQ